jgi:hypothetical protein
MLSQLASKGSTRLQQSIFTAPSSSYNILRAAMSSSSFVVPSWATVDPTKMGTTAEPYAVSNLVDGKWTTAKNVMTIPHPLAKDMHPIFTIPDTQVSELGPFLDSLKKVPKSGVHNPLKKPERYVQYGEISRKVRTNEKDDIHIDNICHGELTISNLLFFLQISHFSSCIFRPERRCRHRKLPSTLPNAS